MQPPVEKSKPLPAKSQEKKTSFLSARRLLSMDFPEPEWVIEGIIPEGSLSILAARPKAGKTFLALQMASSIALGRPFLLKKTKQKIVLFLSYELNQRQVKRRLSTILARMGVDLSVVLSGKVYFPLAFSFSKELKGVEALKELIERWEKVGKKPSVIFVDTYILFRELEGKDRKTKTAYELESEYLAKLRELCSEKNVSIILIYHNRKKQPISGDITEEVMGSTGITGAVNNLLILDRKTSSKEAILRITGHDVEELEIVLTFDKGYFRLRTIADKEQEMIELIINYLKKVGSANQSAIRDYLKYRGYRSAHEIVEILTKYSQETPNTPTYWYYEERKREGGGRPQKLYSLEPLKKVEQSSLMEEDEEKVRVELLKTVEGLINSGYINASEFPEFLPEYGITDFKSLLKNVNKVPLDRLKEYVKSLEGYAPEGIEEDFDF